MILHVAEYLYGSEWIESRRYVSRELAERFIRTQQTHGNLDPDRPWRISETEVPDWYQPSPRERGE